MFPLILFLLKEIFSQFSFSDKLKRSALIHAVLNGNTHIASYLLHLGADPNRCDSSGNSVVHYAAAYGWLFCLKLLKEAGAELGLSNQWKVGFHFYCTDKFRYLFIFVWSGFQGHYILNSGFYLYSLNIRGWSHLLSRKPLLFGW